MRKTLSVLARTLGPATLAFLSIGAQAHVGGDAGAHHGFMAGFWHPFTGLDHLGAMLAVGIWSGTSTRRPWIAPVAFALTLLAGALLAQHGWQPPFVEPMIAASLLVLGLLLAAQVQLPSLAAALLVGAFAWFHGAAHGQELGAGSALIGMVLATALLHAIGMVMGLAMQSRSIWWPRLTGAAVTLAGAGFVWPLIAP